MIVENIDVVIDKAGCMPPDVEHDEAGNDDPDLCDVIELSGMRHPNRDMDVTTEFSVFSTPALCDAGGGEANVMLGQGL